MDILANLNPAQKEAVEAINGPVLILAGPGSGKTRVITHRVAYLIKTCGVSPRRILAVTFTNKAAREMTERLEKLVAGSVKEVTVGTFHAICAKFLHIDGKVMKIDPNFVIYDEDDQMALVKRAFEMEHLDPKQPSPAAILAAISGAKSKMQSPGDYSKRARSDFEEVAGRIYTRYQQLLGESNALDFDDLLLRTVELFKKHPEVLQKYQERFLHVMVDEFQDTNLVQYEMVKMLGGKYKNICVVGDPDQSIYSWRAADLRNILSFEHDFKGTKVIFLEQNYRSTRTILETASHVIAANQHRKPLQLWTENDAGEQVMLVEAFTEQEEAQFVVREIERLTAAGKFKGGDFAVMYRTNAQSRVLEETFVRYGIPYRLVAGTKFYERREIKDIIAYFRLLHNPQDSVSLWRVINVPGRGIGDQTLDRLAAWAQSLGISPYEALKALLEDSQDAKHLVHPFTARAADALCRFIEMIQQCREKSRELNLVEMFDLLTEASGYKVYTLADPDGQDRWDNVLELRSKAEQYRDLPPAEALQVFLENVALVSDTDDLEITRDRVTLITLHQSKGLEFPVVFIIGVEEKLLPHIRSFDDPEQMEEERRVFYVGITRAKLRVYLLHSFRRNFMGQSQSNPPSRFLADIPAHLTRTPGRPPEVKPAESIYTWTRTKVGEMGNNVPAPPSAQKEFKDGERVRHPQFGDGVVVSSRQNGADTEVTVAFPGAGLKRLVLSYARLEKI